MANIKRANASGITKTGTAISDVPDAPTIGTATAGAEQATVTFTAAATGGSVTTYRALSTPGSIAGTSATSPITVSGLTAGTSYTFQIRGENSTGNSAYSSASNSVTPTVPTSFESIATVTVGAGGSSSIDFTSIPNTYQHLQLRLIARETASATNDYMIMRFNSNSSGGKYHMQQASADGTTVGAGTFYSFNQYYTQRITGANAGANMFGGVIIDIADYKNTNKFKTLTTLGGNNRNGSGLFYLTTGYWADTSAIDTITITPGSGNFVQYSHFALYGMKAA